MFCSKKYDIYVKVPKCKCEHQNVLDLFCYYKNYILETDPACRMYSADTRHKKCLLNSM